MNQTAERINDLTSELRRLVTERIDKSTSKQRTQIASLRARRNELARAELMDATTALLEGVATSTLMDNTRLVGEAQNLLPSFDQAINKLSTEISLVGVDDMKLISRIHGSAHALDRMNQQLATHSLRGQLPPANELSVCSSTFRKMAEYSAELANADVKIQEVCNKLSETVRPVTLTEEQAA